MRLNLDTADAPGLQTYRSQRRVFADYGSCNVVKCSEPILELSAAGLTRLKGSQRGLTA